MDNFQLAVLQARKETWAIIADAYKEIRKKDDKLIEYILVHLIKTVPHAKIKLGERWTKRQASKDKKFLEVDKKYAIFIELEDKMSSYYKDEDDIDFLRSKDTLYISAHIPNSMTMCCESIGLEALTLEKLTDTVNAIIQTLNKHS